MTEQTVQTAQTTAPLKLVIVGSGHQTDNIIKMFESIRGEIQQLGAAAPVDDAAASALEVDIAALQQKLNQTGLRLATDEECSAYVKALPNIDARRAAAPKYLRGKVYVQVAAPAKTLLKEAAPAKKKKQRA